MTNNLKTEDIQDLIINTRMLLQGIRKGVNFDGETRKFDLLDYYEVMNIKLDKLLSIVGPYLTKVELETLSGFIKRYHDDIRYNKSNQDYLLATKITVGIKFDDTGKVIAGTGREISNDEKQAIIDDLRERKIPLTRSTYYESIRRIATGESIKNRSK